ncbi:unnamed protein product [Adineta ricciae]|uniref:Uncharacterized protein n=1 Tax=Adineta ricciae TaxID=249248 RepID=A0A814ZW34_ADIRI|nr:unnamed protein product [Adineta ricciae]CAF1249164.1 unnamed protein product [Adineta ricciae]
MDKTNNPCAAMLEQLHTLEQSIHILTLVNNDLRQILRKHKPLPKFIREALKQSTISKSKATSALPPAPPSLPPTETEEMRLAASVIDKAKRTIENIGEKKSKPSPLIVPPILPPTQSNSSRPKTAISSTRPPSARSTTSNPSEPQQSTQPPVRRYVPAHIKAPFLTQPERKRRPGSTVRNSSQTNPNQRTSATQRSASQQRQLSSTSVPQQVTQTLAIPSAQPVETNSINGNPHVDATSQEIVLPNLTSVHTTFQEPVDNSQETIDINISPVPDSIILNRTLVKPLRRLWKQNQTLRVRLKRDLEKKSIRKPSFIDRLDEQIHSSITIDQMHVPNIEVLLQLAAKLRAIILHLLETSKFDDLGSTLKRLNTLKHLANQYRYLFIGNSNILVSIQRPQAINTNINIDEWLNKPKESRLNRTTIRYTDDSQLIAFTEVRFKQFENECRLIELNWHEQLINQFKQTVSNPDQNPLRIYRELMSLVTGLQTSTPIVVENRHE